jgi:hypothetical protein
MTEEVQELEVETQETNPIEDLINNITAGELNKAEGSFNDILNNKLADSLEAQRIQVAQDVFNTPEGLDDEEDIVDETIEDEDETLELGGEGEDGLDADIEAEDEISDEEIEDAIEQVFDEDEEILAELDDDEDETEAVE